MFKKLKFWFDVIKGCVNAYEEACTTHNINPLDNVKKTQRKSNVQSNKG